MSRSASLPASARIRSWPPMPTPPAGSPPNATSGCSPPIAWTPDTSSYLRAAIRQTCSAGTLLQSVNDVKRRSTGAAQVAPEQRWAALADQLDLQLLRQKDWPALAQL